MPETIVTITSPSITVEAACCDLDVSITTSIVTATINTVETIEFIPASSNYIFTTRDTHYEKLTINIPGVTTFTLSKISTLPGLSILFYFGVKMSYGSDYVINSDQLTWYGFPLDSNSIIELYYS